MDYVSFQVQDKIFKIPLITISFYKNYYISAFNNNPNEPLIIDANPKHFQIVLDFARYQVIDMKKLEKYYASLIKLAEQESLIQLYDYVRLYYFIIRNNNNRNTTFYIEYKNYIEWFTHPWNNNLNVLTIDHFIYFNYLFIHEYDPKMFIPNKLYINNASNCDVFGNAIDIKEDIKNLILFYKQKFLEDNFITDKNKIIISQIGFHDKFKCNLNEKTIFISPRYICIKSYDNGIICIDIIKAKELNLITFE